VLTEPDLDAILKRNPQVNPDMLKASRKLTKALREAGVRGVGYRLTAPHSRQKAHVISTQEKVRGPEGG